MSLLSRFFVAVVPVALALGGCGDSGWTKGDLGTLAVNAAAFRVLNPGHAVEDVHHTVLTINGTVGSETHEYFALVGPFPEKDPLATVKPDSLFFDPAAAPARFGLNPTEPGIDLEAGYAYVCGSRPITRTRRISTTSTGTTYLVQIDGAVERVILLDLGESSKVSVTRLATTDSFGTSIPSKTVELTDKETYVELGADHSISDPPLALSAAPASLRDWIAEVRARAESAGVK